MKYTSLAVPDREELLTSLEAMPDFLRRAFRSLSAAEAATPGPGEAFSPVEQCWHLADLEREGFSARIQRLQKEDQPLLPDFDGGRLAKERQYRHRALSEGLSAFAEARRANVEALRSMRSEQWPRAGTQEGVGPVMLCDIPIMMLQHDSSHRAEIDTWLMSARGRRTRA
jgi:hypothetical protein